MQVDRLIDQLNLGLRDDLEARAVLVQWLTPVARVDDYFAARVAKLRQLLDPELVPDEAVRHLAATVGIGSDLPAAARATTAQLRKLIPVAVALWRIKGTRPSWRALVQALAGSRCLVLDWFYLRTISGSAGTVHVIPGPYVSSGAHYSNPERVTDLWFQDPAGSADLDFLARFLEVVRPAGERINLYAADMIDDLGPRPSQWTAPAGGSGSARYDADAWSLSTRGVRELRTDLGGLEAAWTDYHATLRLAVTGQTVIRFYWTDAANHYRVQVNQAAGTISLYRVAGGVASLLASATRPLTAGHPYLWAVEGWTASSSVTLRVYLDGWKAIDVIDAAADRRTAGALQWGGTGASALATLSAFLLWQRGLAPIRIGPSP